MFFIYSEPLEIVWRYHLSFYLIFQLELWILYPAISVNGNIYFYWNYSEYFSLAINLETKAYESLSETLILSLQHDVVNFTFYIFKTMNSAESNQVWNSNGSHSKVANIYIVTHTDVY